MPLPNPLITLRAKRLGGTPVFAGTRVPVQTLLDYFEGGDSLDDFLLDFPSVTREHAIAVLEAADRGELARRLLGAGRQFSPGRDAVAELVAERAAEE